MLRSVNVEVEDNFIQFKYQGDDDILYKSQLNIFEENTGLTIQNVGFDIPAYVLELKQYGTSILCGHIVDNIAGFLKNEEMENILLIIDFYEVKELSENFIEQYIRFLLSTKSKVISINQNTNINNAISQYVESIIDIQDVKE